MAATLGVLGPLRVVVDDVEVPVRGLQARILMVLVANRPRSVSDDVLVDRCWPNESPKSAVGSMRNTIMRLRRTIGFDAIVRDSHGYRLGDNIEVDIDEFDRVVLAADQARDRGDLADARALVDTALALVRGGAFQELSNEEWMPAKVRDCEDRIAIAGDRWVELSMLLGDRGATARARMFASERPEREVRWLSLVRLFADIGDRVDALRCYQQARAALAEFGIEPSEELAAVERRVLDGLIVRRIGDRRAQPASRSSPGTSQFVGREQVLSSLSQLVAPGTLITVVGVGGIGKTRLAEEVLARTSNRFGGRSIFVSVSHGGSGRDVSQQIAHALGIIVDPGDPESVQVDRVISVLADRPGLMVLDEADQCLEAVRSVAERLRDSGWCVLVTSRWRLQAVGEQAVTLEAMELPATDGDKQHHDVLASEAAQLFVHELSHVVRTDRDLSAVGMIVGHVGGNPLAIQLCARLADSLSLEDVELGLRDRGNVLELETSRAGRKLRQIFDHLLERLGPDDLAVFARLGMILGDFTMATAMSVADTGDLTIPVVVSMSRLVAVGLVATTGTARLRFRLDPLQLARAKELLAQRQETALVSQRIIDRYIALGNGARSRLRGRQQREALADVWAEIAGIRHVLEDRAFAQPQERLAIAGALGEFWFFSGLWVEGMYRIDEALAASAGSSGPERAVALIARARSGGVLASIRDSIDQLSEASAIAEHCRLHDLAGEAKCWLGLARMSSGDVDTGLQMLKDVTKGDGRAPWAAAQAQLLLCMAAAVAGSIDRATSHGYSAVNAFVDLGDELNAANALKNIGVMLQRHGDATTARRDLEEALRLAAGTMPAVQAQARYALAEIDAESGTFNDSALDGLRTDLRRLGDLSLLSGTSRLLARSMRQNNNVAGALAMLRECVPHLAGHDQQALGLVLVDIAEIYVDQGRRTDAMLLVRGAGSLVEGTGFGWNAQQRTRLHALFDSLAVGGPSSKDRRLVQAAIRAALN